MTSVAFENRWQDVILKLERTYSPTKYDTWRTQLSSECSRQFGGLTLDNFDCFCTSEYDSLPEARQALIEMYRNGMYQASKPPTTYTFIHKSGAKATLSELQIESHSRTKLDLAPVSVYKLIDNPRKTTKSWKLLSKST